MILIFKALDLFTYLTLTSQTLKKMDKRERNLKSIGANLRALHKAYFPLSFLVRYKLSHMSSSNLFT
jgi:hypothetical protein